MAFEKSTIKIPSVTAGWNLDVWQYIPTRKSSKPLPVIIMAHGLGCNKLMGLSTYAENFVKAGYACLVFDYRHWGASDGFPRDVIVVKNQLEDYRTVIKYARQQPEFDPQRVIVWGSSFSGGHAITLACMASLSIVAAISQCPWVGVGGKPLDNLAYIQAFFYVILDAIRQFVGLSPVYIPSGAAPGKLGALTTEGSLEGLRALCENTEDWPNRMSASSLLQINKYHPRYSAANIKCPLLLIAPEDDNLCILSGAQNVAMASTSVQLHKIPQAGHFDVYPGFKDYKISSNAQLKFLKKYVPV